MNGNKLMLRLTGEEAQELGRILLAAHQETVRALSDQAGCGYSRGGVDLCSRRSRIGHLIECLEGLHGPQAVPVQTSRKPSLSAAA